MGKHSKICQILALKSASVVHKSISKQLKVCLKTVYNVLKGYQETGATSKKPFPCRKCKACTKHHVDMVPKKVSMNPGRSIHKIAKDLQKSRGTIRRIVKEDLGMKPFKIPHRHLISQGSKAKRQDRTKKILQAMRSACDKVFIWSGGKIFMVEPQMNTHRRGR